MMLQTDVEYIQLSCPDSVKMPCVLTKIVPRFMLFPILTAQGSTTQHYPPCWKHTNSIANWQIPHPVLSTYTTYREMISRT